MKKWNQIIILFLISMALGLSACLKTRSQLREDSDDPSSRPIPVQPVQDVQVQGRYVLDELKSEVTQMEGRLQDLEREQKDLTHAKNAAVKEDLGKLDTRVSHLEKELANLTVKLDSLQEQLLLKDPDELLSKAKDFYKKDNFQAAADTLGVYLKSSKARKAEEAYFLRGESFYKLKEYNKAVVEYSKLPEKFPHSVRSPEALYKIGLSFDALDLREDAKGFYQEIIEKYPKSPEAKKAKKKIKGN
jgi:TolA-binding protein